MILLATPPSVFVVGNDYIVCASVTSECTLGVEVGGRVWFDHSNGTLRSGSFLHMVRLPQKALDRAGAYTLRLRKLNERKPYFTDYGEEEAKTFAFRPVADKPQIKIINLPDAHCRVDRTVAAGGYFGTDLDLLILNGDIPDHSGTVENFKPIYEISGRITHGHVPCVFARGNHDLRGCFAEKLADYTPTDAGRSYYTFRAGPVWGIVLDCGEDKPDDCLEYGMTICCHEFRLEVDEFLDRVLASREWEGARLRLVIVHKPICYEEPPPFDIEKSLYRTWCSKLKEVQPHLMLTGHLHTCFAEKPGGAHDDYGQPCLHVCSSRLGRDADYACGAIALSENQAHIRFVNSAGAVETEFLETLD